MKLIKNIFFIGVIIYSIYEIFNENYYISIFDYLILFIFIFLLFENNETLFVKTKLYNNKFLANDLSRNLMFLGLLVVLGMFSMGSYLSATSSYTNYGNETTYLYGFSEFDKAKEDVSNDGWGTLSRTDNTIKLVLDDELEKKIRASYNKEIEDFDWNNFKDKMSQIALSFEREVIVEGKEKQTVYLKIDNEGNVIYNYMDSFLRGDSNGYQNK